MAGARCNRSTSDLQIRRSGWSSVCAYAAARARRLLKLAFRSGSTRETPTSVTFRVPRARHRGCGLAPVSPPLVQPSAPMPPTAIHQDCSFSRPVCSRTQTRHRCSRHRVQFLPRSPGFNCHAQGQSVSTAFDLGCFLGAGEHEHFCFGSGWLVRLLLWYPSSIRSGSPGEEIGNVRIRPPRDR